MISFVCPMSDFLFCWYVAQPLWPPEVTEVVVNFFLFHILIEMQSLAYSTIVFRWCSKVSVLIHYLQHYNIKIGVQS